MKIIDGIKLKGKPARIPDCDRNDLPEFFKDMGFTTGVEIGVDKGEFSEVLCKGGMKMYCVDPWGMLPDYQHPRGQERLDFLYEHTKRVLAPYDATIIRKTSMEAVKDFQDNSIDFVYIDGHHGFKYVAEDIWEWSKKVKKGGVISGHDYARTKHKEIHDPFSLHVKHVVDGYTQALGIENWYLLGSDESKPGEKREMFRSWLWLNP